MSVAGEPGSAAEKEPAELDLEDWVDARDSAPRGAVSKVSSWLHALRYYRKRQVVRRLWNLAGARLRRTGICRPAPVKKLGALRPSSAAESVLQTLFRMRMETTERSRPLPNSLESVARGEICLLNHPLAVGNPIDWRIAEYPEVAYLWRFQLHYHEFLLQMVLTAPECERTRQMAFSVIHGWIIRNPIDSAECRRDAWHPYCISRRIPVWLTLLSLGAPGGPSDASLDLCQCVGASPPLFDARRGRGDASSAAALAPTLFRERARGQEESFREVPAEAAGKAGTLRDVILESLYAQAAFLVRNLEWDLRGNHLLENLKAVCMAACVCPGSESEQWLQKVLPILRHELQRQIRPYGEHYERSPMYHCQVLGNLLELAAVGEGVSSPLHRLCVEQAEPMLSFLDGIIHPDGEMPLFADSCFGEAPSAAYIRAVAKHLGMRRESFGEAGPVTGPHTRAGKPSRVDERGPYWTFRHGGDFLIFDRGNVGADELPAHSHCDLLTLEASFAGQRVLVDSGLYNYADDPMRRYVRSSEAHNVVTVDYQNQCDVWSNFRMGYRGWATPGNQGESDGFQWSTAYHNAYRRLGVKRMQRLVAGHPDRIWMCLDRVSDGGRRDATSAEFTGYLHFAPSVWLEPIAADQYQLSTGSEVLYLRLLNLSRSTVADGWYCPEFGRRERAQVLVYSAAALPFGWVIAGHPFECALRHSRELCLTVKSVSSADQEEDRAAEPARAAAGRLDAGRNQRRYELRLEWDCD